jgi:hypothetical protein
MALGPRSPALYAISQRDVGVYGQGKEGAFFTTNQVGPVWPGRAGVNVSTAYMWNPGVLINTTVHASQGVHADT